MRLVKDRESYEGENKSRKGISDNIAYEFCHFEPLYEAKQFLCKAYEEATTRLLRWRSQ